MPLGKQINLQNLKEKKKKKRAAKFIKTEVFRKESIWII